MKLPFPKYPSINATDNPLAHAFAWINTHDYENAIDCCDFVLDHWDANSFDALETKGYALFCLENYSDAIYFLEAALSIQNDDDVREYLEDAIRLEAEQSLSENQ